MAESTGKVPCARAAQATYTPLLSPSLCSVPPEASPLDTRASFPTDSGISTAIPAASRPAWCSENLVFPQHLSSSDRPVTPIVTYGEGGARPVTQPRSLSHSQELSALRARAGSPGLRCCQPALGAHRGGGSPGWASAAVCESAAWLSWLRAPAHGLLLYGQQAKAVTMFSEDSKSKDYGRNPEAVCGPPAGPSGAPPLGHLHPCHTLARAVPTAPRAEARGGEAHAPALQGWLEQAPREEPGF